MNQICMCFVDYFIKLSQRDILDLFYFENSGIRYEMAKKVALKFGIYILNIYLCTIRQ